MNAEDKVRCSVVVPCYKSKATLPELVERLDRTLRERGGGYEILLVHDASGEDTWREIERLAARYPAVKGVDLAYNVGQFRATLCGLAKAKGQSVVTMDDDLQHPPEEVAKLLDRLESANNIDCVIGAYDEKKHAGWRRWGTSAYAWLAEQLYQKPRDLEMTSFRAMRRSLAWTLAEYRTAKPFLEILILRCTKRILNVPVAHHPRKVGKSGYNWRRLVRIVADNIVGTSALPLRSVGWFGGGCMLLALATALGMGIAALFGALDFTAAKLGVLVAAFFGGAILGTLGMIGEYLARLMQEVSGPAPYVVRQTALHPPTPDLANAPTHSTGGPANGAAANMVFNGPEN